MKKNVIALAVAAALTAPMAAQAAVTVSGGLQAEVVSVGGDAVGGQQTGLYAADGGEYGKESGGSYGFLKFSASEDLGGGMKALAMWNGVANVGDTGSAGGITGRDAYVGLTGGFGTVLAGTLSTPYKSSTVKWDPFVMTSLQARGNGGMSDAQNGYASNALAYANKFGPATVVVALVVDEGTDPTDGTKLKGEHAKSISVNAPVGPVEVAVAYVDASKFSDISGLGLGSTASLLSDVTTLSQPGFTVGVSDKQSVAGLPTLTASKVGVKWTSGPITVAGQYEMLDLDGTKPTVTYLTASYAMGANTISLGAGTTSWDISGLDDSQYMAIGVKHAFSKTTSATLGYRSTDMGNMPSVSYDDAGVVTGVAEAKAENVTSIGLRVGF